MTVHRRHRWTLAFAALLSGSAARADVLPADASRASALFEQGRKDLASKRVDAACDAFAASFGLDPQPGTRLNLAVCRAQQDRLTEAYVLFEEALADAEATSKQGRSTYARDQLRALEGRLVRVHVVLTNATGATVTMNGVEIDPAKRQLAKPGKVAIDVTAPERQPYHVDKIADAGAEITVDVPSLQPIGSDAPTSVTPDRPAPSPSGALTMPITAPMKETEMAPSRGPAPYVAGAIGGSLLLGAGGLTLHARSRWQAAFDDRDAAGVTSAQHEADAATVMSIAGGVAIGVCIFMWVRGGKSDRLTVTAAPHGIAVMGAF